MDAKSLAKLSRVDAELSKVIQLAYTLSPIKFIVTEGVRTLERQKELYEKKLSKTMNSKHLKGRAVDIAIIKDGVAIWDMQEYKKVAVYVKQAAASLNVRVECGADWGWDGPHIELRG